MLLPGYISYTKDIISSIFLNTSLAIFTCFLDYFEFSVCMVHNNNRNIVCIELERSRLHFIALCDVAQVPISRLPSNNRVLLVDIMLVEKLWLTYLNRRSRNKVNGCSPKGDCYHVDGRSETKANAIRGLAIITCIMLR